MRKLIRLNVHWMRVLPDPLYGSALLSLIRRQLLRSESTCRWGFDPLGHGPLWQADMGVGACAQTGHITARVMAAAVPAERRHIGAGHPTSGLTTTAQHPSVEVALTQITGRRPLPPCCATPQPPTRVPLLPSVRRWRSTLGRLEPPARRDLNMTGVDLCGCGIASCAGWQIQG